MSLLVAVFALALAGQDAIPPSSTPAADTATAAERAGASAPERTAGQQRVCRSQPDLRSRIGRQRVCRTQADWDRLQYDTQRNLDENFNNGLGRGRDVARPGGL